MSENDVLVVVGLSQKGTDSSLMLEPNRYGFHRENAARTINYDF